MKSKIQNFLLVLKEYYNTHPKRFWAFGVILIIIIFYFATHKTTSNVIITTVSRSDLKQTILSTGQVTAATDLNLSFSSNGLVSTLPVSVGDKVKKGEIVSTLRNNNEYAALKLAQANYQKVADGSSNEEVAVAQASLNSVKTSLENIKRTQDTLVENAHRALLNVSLIPNLTTGTSGTAPTITGLYSSNIEGSYIITLRITSNNSYFTYSGVEEGIGSISSSTPKPLGTKGLYIQFPTDYATSENNIWTVLLPNTTSVGYLTASNSYQNALKTRDSAIAAAEAAVNEAQATLDLKRASARPADLAAVQASIDQAQAAYENTILRAPADGTIVHVDTKIGERADAQKEVIVLQDISNLHVESNINETNIAKLAVGQPVTMTLDAFGPEQTFSGKVIQIDPSSTTNDGVVNYKIKTSIEMECKDTAICSAANIRPGMNANMTITSWDHPNVIAIPKAALVTKDNETYVHLITDEKNEKFVDRKIETGFLGDGNLIEVINGLSDGEKIVVGK